MKFCTLLICCVLMGQNVIGRENETTTEDSETSDQDQNNYNEHKPQNLSTFKLFSSGLYEEVKKSHPQNFVLSPLSLTNALAMVGLGARNETAKEILRIFRADNNAELIKGQSNLSSSLKEISSGNSGVKFVSADKIYAQSGWTLKTDYKNNVTLLGGEIETVDFGNGEKAAGKINGWVHNKTEGKIEKLVESSDLSDGISLFVVNAIYFKGSWGSKFDKTSTRKKPFYINGSCSVNVDMMTQENKFQHADLKDAEAQVIVLPYEGARLSMMVYLPKGKEEGALDSLENWLADKSPFDIQEKFLNNSYPGDVLVSLPKFKIRSSLNLNEPLQNLDLGKMFDETTADFSGIFNNSVRLFVSKVSQETFIEVNEEGTEAAAATGIGLAATSFSSTPEFTADRPFLFQIVDIQTKTVFFSGRVKNPLDSGSGGSAASAGQAEEQSCIKVPKVQPTTMSPETRTSASQKIDATHTGTKQLCQGDQKSDIEKMLMNFCNSPLVQNPTGNVETNLKTRAATFAEDVMSCAGTKAKVTIENLKQTAEGLRSRNEKLEQEQKKRNETDCPCSTGNGAETSTTTENPREENLRNLPASPPAVARGSYSGDEKPWTWEYNVTENGPCFTFNRTTNSVYIKGSSCVALYQAGNCTQEKLQISITKSSSFPEVGISYKIAQTSKSIGVCS